MRLNYEKFLSWPLSFFASFAGRLIKMLAFFFVIVVGGAFVVDVVVVVAFLMKKFLTLFLLFLILRFGFFVRFCFWRWSCAVISGFLLVLHTHSHPPHPHIHYYESSVDVENKRWHVVDYQYSLAVFDSNSGSLCVCVQMFFYYILSIESVS